MPSMGFALGNTFAGPAATVSLGIWSWRLGAHSVGWLSRADIGVVRGGKGNIYWICGSPGCCCWLKLLVIS